MGKSNIALPLIVAVFVIPGICTLKWTAEIGLNVNV